MSRRYPWELALLSSLPSFVACASGAVSYSGASQRPVVHPTQLRSGDQAPPGLRRLGHLAASCRLADAREGLDGAALSDVGCSTALLSAALRDRAAAAGGSFLVDLSCAPAGELRPGQRATCSADAWGPTEPAQYPIASPPTPINVDPSGPAAPLAPAHGAVGEAWLVIVDYWPASGHKPRAPIPPERVGEIDFPRAGFVRFGDVRARADDSCSIETLRGAVRALAARVGATSVVDVRCVSGDGKRQCVASVAGPEVDDGPIAEVR